MNSPDTTRLAAALAKLDDPEIITLLLEVVLPKQMRDEPSPPSPPSPAATKGGYRMVETPNKNQKWTDNDDAWLIDLTRAGHNDSTIAEWMGRSRMSVISRRKRITGVWK